MQQLDDDLMAQAEEVALNLEEGDTSEATCAQAVEVIRALLAAAQDGLGVAA